MGIRKFNDGFTGITFEYFLKQIGITEDEFYDLSDDDQEPIIQAYEKVAWK